MTDLLGSFGRCEDEGGNTFNRKKKNECRPDPEHDLDPTDWCTNITDAEVNKIGKTVFFTRKEAEAKLNEMEGEHDIR